MNEERFRCLHCQNEFTLQRHRKSRWVAAGVGALLGTAVTENILGGALAAALAYGVAKAMDE